MAETPKTAFVTLNVEGQVSGWQVLNNYHLAGFSMEGVIRWEAEVNSPTFIASLLGKRVPLEKLSEFLDKVSGVTAISILFDGAGESVKWPMPSLDLLKMALADLAAKPEGFVLTWENTRDSAVPLKGQEIMGPRKPVPAGQEKLWSVLDMPIADFIDQRVDSGAKVRIENCFRAANLQKASLIAKKVVPPIRYVGDLVCYWADETLQRYIPHFGRKSRNALLEALAELAHAEGLPELKLGENAPLLKVDWMPPTA